MLRRGDLVQKSFQKTAFAIALLCAPSLASSALEQRTNDTVPDKGATLRSDERPNELGLSLAALDDMTRRRFRIPESVKQGVVVTGVEEGSAASEKRMRTGNVIIEFGQESVRTLANIEEQIAISIANGKRTIALLVADDSGQPRFIPLPLPASRRRPVAESVAAPKHAGSASDRMLPAQQATCNGSLAEPAARDLGEGAAKQTALAVGNTPAAAFSSSEKLRENALSDQLSQMNGWLRDEDAVFGKFLALLQDKFNRHRLGQYPENLGEALRTGPALGINVGPITDEHRQAFGIEQAEGIVIRQTPDRGSPAENVKLRYGDVLTSMNGVRLRTARDLVELVRSMEPGEVGSLVVIRDGSTMNVRVTLGARDPSGRFRESSADRRQIKEQLKSCFPSLERALNLLADRQDEGRLLTLREVAGEAEIAVTNCSDVVRSTRPDNATKDALAKIRGAQIQRLGRDISQELEDQVPGIFTDQKAKSGGSADRATAFTALAENFRRALKEKAVAAGDTAKPIVELADAMSVSQTAACFPSFGKPLGQLAALIQNEETTRRQEQGRAQAAIEQREQQKQRAIDAEYARSPEGVLAASYDAYINVRQCYEARKGYNAVYVSNSEMEESKDAVKRIEQSLKSKLDRSMSTDDVWERVSGKRRDSVGRDYQEYMRRRCGIWLGSLTRILREQGFSEPARRKDF